MAAIYQEARPFTFEQVVGQGHVKSVLVAALGRGRVGHAYLFSGPRGVGKTTTARLLAMAVNCEAPEPADRPCGACESCQLVRRNSHPDVIELDAASNNSVEDIRDLREKVGLASMRGGQRVWVLDEAHMLSRAASNALLKTLEEPPDNLVFILATTEPEKLPPTILSRCQHFRFRRLSGEEIMSKLQRLCEEREVEADAGALGLVAQAADGAMRDAESLLERLLTSGDPITRQGVEDALGLPPGERMQTLARALSQGNIDEVFALASGLYHDGFAPSSLAEHLSKTLRDALYAQVTNQKGGFTLELDEADLLRVIHALDDENERFSRRNDLFSLEVALIKGMNALMRNLPQDAVAPLAAHKPAPVSGVQPSAQPQSGSGLPDFNPHKAPPPRTQAAAPPPPNKPPQQVTAAAEEPGGNGAAQETFNWHKIKTEANAQLKAFLSPAQNHIEGQIIKLTFSDKHKFHFTQLKSRQDELAGLISKLYEQPFELILEGPGDSARKKY